MRDRTERGSVLDRVYHPFFFAAFPLFFLVQHNVRLLTPLEALPVVGATLGLVAALYVIGRWRGADRVVLGLRLSILVVWFFAYGHIALLTRSLFSSVQASHAVLFPIWTMLALVLVLVARRARGRGASLTRILNGASAVMMLVAAIPIGVAFAQGATTTTQGSAPFAPYELGVDPSRDRPNIYYLVFDRYAGAGTLRDLHGFDNSPFLGELTRRGFAVQEDALGNYPSTAFSLASSLNMTHLHPLDDRTGADESLVPVQRAVQLNSVARTLQHVGYRYLHIGSWWDGTRVSAIADVSYPMFPWSEFQQAFYESTAISPVIAAGGLGAADLPQLHHDIALRQFDTIDRVADERGPKFVFAHVLLPHPPYVFDRTGGRVYDQPDSYEGKKAAYIDQLVYTNARILEMLDTIERDDPGAVIVVQSDEGPHPGYWSRGVDWTTAADRDLLTKFRILNAYRLPGIDPAAIPEGITPANTFRFLLREYFGASLQMIEDASYVSAKTAPYEFTAVTDRLRP